MNESGQELRINPADVSRLNRNVINPADVINGFSPSFARILLERLIEYKKQVSSSMTPVSRTHKYAIAPFAAAILYHLRSQVLGDKNPIPSSKDGWEVMGLIHDTIAATEDFLTLFEASEENPMNPHNLISLDELLESGNIGVIDIGDLAKDLQSILRSWNIDISRPGLIIKTSRCHPNAPVIVIEGGIRQEICSKCRRSIQEIRYK